MAQTTTLYCTGGGYAWQSRSDGASSSAGNSFYMGNVWNKTDHRDYNSSMGYTCSPSNFGNGLPIVITKISATAVVRKFAPSKPLKIYVNDTYGPYHSQYNEKGYLGESGVNNNNFSFSFERNNNTVEVFNTLATYLQTGTTFYVHWWNSSSNTGNGAGGIAKGFTEYKTPLEITWEYAATDGSLNSTSYNTGTTATLTIKPQDSTFKHDITWKINNNTIQTTTKASASTTNFKCSFSPNSEQIGTWFGSSAKSRTGTVSITTYSSSGLNLGTVTKSFTLNLTKETCIDVKDIVFNSSDMSLSPSNNVALASNYVVGKTNIKCTGKYTNKSSKATISSFYVSLSGGITSHNLSLTKTSGTSVSATTSYKISSQKNISAVFTLIDSRGLTFTHTKTISASNIKTYSPPVIKNISFFRTKDGTENIEGKNLGGQFKITLDSKFISDNPLKEVKIEAKGLSSSFTQSKDFPSHSNGTYSFKNMSFLSNLSTTSSYEITITATDKLGISTSSVFNLGTSQYIIHIPSGGKGLGFGATAENGYINLGWPIKGLKIAGTGTNGTVTYLDLSSISSLDGFNKALGGPFLPTSGGTLTGNLTISRSSNSGGIYLKDSSGALSGGIYYNGTNLWIGSIESETNHHVGGTYISAGYNGTKGNRSAFIGIPNAENTNASSHEIYHRGMIFYSAESTTTPGTPAELPNGMSDQSKTGMIWLCPVD